jgi:hypothetical protein
MWHFDQGERSGDYLPGPIPSELARKEVFVFLGRRQRVDRAIDYEAVLLDFDRLLELYRYVESPSRSNGIQSAPFTFRPGCSVKAASTSYTHAQMQLDIALRHNELQRALYSRLVEQHGEDNVGTEHPSFFGTRVDVIVRDGTNLWYYEIKTSQSPRACMREAIGQLLEYSFWPGSQSATRLVVVGETPLDDDGAAYLARLKQQFALPLEYESIAIPNSPTTA